MAQVDAVVEVLRRVGADHGDRSPGQVALAWLIAQGAVPIPGAKNREQAEQNAGALGWRLTDEELALLTGSALHGTRTVQQRIWQHG
jgi:aryl-alcohol dehydrogenase-like predicted oxidoreductase